MQSQSGRIVVGYDGSEAAGAALDWAAAQAQRRRRGLTVLQVLDYFEVTPGPIGVTGWPDLSEAALGAVAAEGVARARKTAESLDVAAITELGHVARTLIEVSHNAELVVLGTRGHGDLAGAILGSVSIAVSAHAGCPVVVVRGDSGLLPGPHRPVVIGVDESAGAEAALRFAAQTAIDTGAQLIVVSAYQPALLEMWTGIVSNTVDTATDPSYIASTRSATEKVLADAARTAQSLHPELKITQRALQGAPAAVIAAATYQAGLAVVGGRGRGGFAGLMLGSVSNRLLHSALCPVAVVRTRPSLPPTDPPGSTQHSEGDSR